jgi:NhaP-type Na+/H+ or K+/H+ antiporter
VIAVGQNVAGADTLVTTVVCTVTLSILAHGLSANPLADAFAARVKTEATQRT